MSDAPLSRRARRAADDPAVGDPTRAFAEAVVTGEIPALGPDGQPLSRRDRRRLERVASPMEAWTAEEEAIATGQIPLVQPVQIAELERLERERAAQADWEARQRTRDLSAAVGYAADAPAAPSAQSPSLSQQPPAAPRSRRQTRDARDAETPSLGVPQVQADGLADAGQADAWQRDAAPFGAQGGSFAERGVFGQDPAPRSARNIFAAAPPPGTPSQLPLEDFPVATRGPRYDEPPADPRFPEPPAPRVPEQAAPQQVPAAPEWPTAAEPTRAPAAQQSPFAEQPQPSAPAWGGEQAPAWGGEPAPAWGGETAPAWGGEQAPAAPDARDAYLRAREQFAEAQAAMAEPPVQERAVPERPSDLTVGASLVLDPPADELRSPWQEPVAQPASPFAQPAPQAMADDDDDEATEVVPPPVVDAPVQADAAAYGGQPAQFAAQPFAEPLAQPVQDITPGISSQEVPVQPGSAGLAAPTELGQQLYHADEQQGAAAPSPADEIRRLAAEAISGIESASRAIASTGSIPRVAEPAAGSGWDPGEPWQPPADLPDAPWRDPELADAALLQPEPQGGASPFGEPLAAVDQFGIGAGYAAEAGAFDQAPAFGGAEQAAAYGEATDLGSSVAPDVVQGGFQPVPSFDPAPAFDQAPGFDPAPAFDQAPGFDPAPAFDQAAGFTPAPTPEQTQNFEAAAGFQPVPGSPIVPGGVADASPSFAPQQPAQVPAQDFDDLNSFPSYQTGSMPVIGAPLLGSPADLAAQASFAPSSGAIPLQPMSGAQPVVTGPGTPGGGMVQQAGMFRPGGAPAGAVPTASGGIPGLPGSAGAPPATGAVPVVPPAGSSKAAEMATGQLAALRRAGLPETPDPNQYRMLHLGVITALVFLLGVLIYTVARN